MKALNVTVVCLIVMCMALAGFLVFSRKSAESGCDQDAALRGHSGVSYEWSWWPLGTTCTFDHGPSETRIIW